MGGALAECYRLHLLKKADRVTSMKEWIIILRLIGLVFFTSYLNFNHLQYSTDFYIRKYGYLNQYSKEEAGRL